MTEHKRTEAEQIDPRVHIDHDDHRYDGFRLTEFWAAVITDDQDQEGLVLISDYLAGRYHLNPGPALAGDERRLVHLRELARNLSAGNGPTVRIRHFVAVDFDEVYR